MKKLLKRGLQKCSNNKRCDERKVRMGCNMFIWGTGNNAIRLNQLYSDELARENIIGYIDNDCEKWGKSFGGKKVYPPSFMKDIEYDEIYIYIYISVAKSKPIIEQIRREYAELKIRIVDSAYFFQRKLMSRYLYSEDEEIQEVMRYLDNHPLGLFNYSWTEKYQGYEFEFGHEDGLIYVIHNGKRMFFSRQYDTETKAKNYYISLLIEQDAMSPHRYISSKYEVDEGDVVVDVGAAEGIFSLDVIDKAEKIYIFEPDSDWVEALQHTFSAYNNKVEIIQKCVSNYCDETTVTIDKAISGEIDYLKMDIEGEEFYALCGAERTFSNSNRVKCVVCSYHQEFAYHALKSKLEEFGFETSPSRGYMWFYEHFNEARPATLRRALIRGSKKSEM